MNVSLEVLGFFRGGNCMFYVVFICKYAYFSNVTRADGDCSEVPLLVEADIPCIRLHKIKSTLFENGFVMIGYLGVLKKLCKQSIL
jgi:hypothetical protein